MTDPGEWPKQAERIAAEQKQHNNAILSQVSTLSLGPCNSYFLPCSSAKTGFHSPCAHSAMSGKEQLFLKCLHNYTTTLFSSVGPLPHEGTIASCHSEITCCVLLQQRRPGMAAAQAPQEPASMPDTQPLNQFEQQRAENIARNQTMLAKLGVPLAAGAAVGAAVGPATPTAQGKQAAGTMHRDPGKQQVSAGASHKGATVARDSKGKFIGSSSRRRRARMTAGPLQSSRNTGILPLGSAPPGTSKRQQTSGMTVPLVDGSLASSVACDMATWMQHEGGNAEIASGQWHAGSDQHALEGPSEACAAGSRGEHAALVFPEALVNLGCEVSLEAAPPGVVPGHLFGTAMIPSKGGKKRKAAVATPSGASRIADET